MSWIIKTLLFCYCINFFLAVAGVSLGGSDLINRFVTTDNVNNKLTLNSQFNSSIPTQLEQGGITTTATDVSFSIIDAIKMVWNFSKFLFLAALCPMYWGYILGFPIFLQLLLFPVQIITIVGIIYLIRGVGN